MIKSVAVQIDLEKYSALKMYIEQKNTSIESELEKSTEQLYQKYVPQNVRDFINMKARIMPTNKSRRGSSGGNSDSNSPISSFVSHTVMDDETE